MKKISLLLILLIIVAFAFSSCGSRNMKIENYEWRMRTVMRNNTELDVPAVGAADAAYPESKIVDLTLVAKDGKITITDATNNKTYEGTYSVSGKNPKETDYEITIDGKKGHATVAMTTYADGKGEPTLPINLVDYSIYFYAK